MWTLHVLDGLGLDVAHVGEGLHQVQLVALVDDLVLVGLLAVLGVDLLLKEADIILGRKLAEGRESLCAYMSARLYWSMCMNTFVCGCTV